MKQLEKRGMELKLKVFIARLAVDHGRALARGVKETTTNIALQILLPALIPQLKSVRLQKVIQTYTLMITLDASLGSKKNAVNLLNAQADAVQDPYFGQRMVYSA
jgi:hypothetical protein